MFVFEYGSEEFENQTANAIQTRQPFLVEVRGWRKRVIRTGLRHYLKYLNSRRDKKNKPLSALLIIPFGFVTPTFWVLCVKAEFEGMYPIIQQSADVLIVKFAQRE